MEGNSGQRRVRTPPIYNSFWSVRAAGHQRKSRFWSSHCLLERNLPRILRATTTRKRKCPGGYGDGTGVTIHRDVVQRTASSAPNVGAMRQSRAKRPGGKGTVHPEGHPRLVPPLFPLARRTSEPDRHLPIPVGRHVRLLSPQPMKGALGMEQYRIFPPREPEMPVRTPGGATGSVVSGHSRGRDF